jgi:hypothetical protein
MAASQGLSLHCKDERKGETADRQAKSLQCQNYVIAVIPGHREAMNPESRDDQREIPGSR